ncbi:SURF1 family protein [Bordetella hinzii]|uniref:SURF1-like protein n=2 Tax=Bordetella hinzii TaxID=103855 RepID=A0AAN1RX53_9BORD|nr:SURF1 family protein [Bordetella hinzii]AKQ56791.1 SURF1 family protein [Bordetella hinzii]AKQ61258.1 SURF1 family protein [Bordetella hinzii]AZW17751.1 SURF1 family protein [Bordetella hinzii]KCB22021.1 SURF1 family protein [Bordetella hinzii OH87 BAL007II]KCB30335.1 SURF1 family protein [Bordetella hinzii CA90 BAL1384]
MTGATSLDDTPRNRPPRRAGTLALLALAAALAFFTLCALGSWQLQRRAFKHELIAQVQARLQADRVPAPGAALWAGLTAANAEYRRVSATGRYDYSRQALVKAVTAMGDGYWVMTPLLRDDGSILFVNRGFVLPQWRQAPAAPEAVTVNGLLRMGEPGWGFLRRNDPAADRWYSRDVQGIARARGLGVVAPYFIDADAAPGASDPARAPAGGLTVLRFADNHLVYALTWYALAGLVLAGAVLVAREEKRLRAGLSAPAPSCGPRRPRR